MCATLPPAPTLVGVVPSPKLSSAAIGCPLASRDALVIVTGCPAMGLAWEITNAATGGSPGASATSARGVAAPIAAIDNSGADAAGGQSSTLPKLTDQYHGPPLLACSRAIPMAVQDESSKTARSGGDNSQAIRTSSARADPP